MHDGVSNGGTDAGDVRLEDSHLVIVPGPCVYSIDIKGVQDVVHLEVMVVICEIVAGKMFS